MIKPPRIRRKASLASRLRKEVGKFLSEQGFKKEQGVYFLENEDVFQLIEIQSRSDSRADHCIVTMNIGLHSKAVDTYRGLEGRGPILFNGIASHYQARVSWLWGVADIWLEANSDEVLERLVATFKQLIVETVMPFFRTVQTSQQVLALWSGDNWLLKRQTMRTIPCRTL